jgi:hypothetical protein
MSCTVVVGVAAVAVGIVGAAIRVEGEAEGTRKQNGNQERKGEQRLEISHGETPMFDGGEIRLRKKGCQRKAVASTITGMFTSTMLGKLALVKVLLA